jgi:hypothetical protein
MVELIIKYEPFLYCTSENFTPFYLILNFIAKHKIDDCKNAENLFNLFSNQSQFDINQKYKDLPPPLSFLLSSNYAFSVNTYIKEYISSNIIKTFIEKGASINTRDINSTSILTYAVMVDKNDLVSYCITKGVDVLVMNNGNHDALYYAIHNNNIKNISLILSTNYPLTEKRLAEIDAYTAMPFANEEIRNLLFEKLKNGIKNLENTQVLVRLFPDKRLFFISENFKRANFDITKDQIPALVALFSNPEIVEKSIAFENINSLKKEYIFSSNNLKEFISANNIFPLFVLNEYTTYYFQSELHSNNLLKEIVAFKDIPPTLKALLIYEVENAPIKYYNTTLANGGVSELASLYTNFPSKSEEVEKTAFTKYIYNAFTGYTNYSTTDYYISIDNERKSVSAVRSNCTIFTGYFNNPKYISTAKNKLQECTINYDILTGKYDQAIDYYNRLLKRYNKAFDLLVNNGKTPPYEISKTEISDEDIYYSIKIENVPKQFYTLKFEIRKRSNEFCRYSGFIFNTIYNCSESMGETIRRTCISECRIDNRDFYHMKDSIEFLEKNINGNWYEKKW